MSKHYSHRSTFKHVNREVAMTTVWTFRILWENLLVNQARIQGGGAPAPSYFQKAEDLKNSFTLICNFTHRPFSNSPNFWFRYFGTLFPRDLQVKECVCVGIWLFHDTALAEGQRIPTLNVFFAQFRPTISTTTTTTTTTAKRFI